MPNSIKYNASGEQDALRIGNYHLGVGDVEKGPTASTGYWNGYDPPSSGYTIYLNKASQGPSIYAPIDVSGLISITNQISGESFTTDEECFVWFAGQNDKMVVNKNYEGIVTEGLEFLSDPGFVPSYPQSGNTNYDVSQNTYTGTLTNTPLYDQADGGTFEYDGADTFIDFGGTNLNMGTSDATLIAWVNIGSIPSGYRIAFGKGYAGSGNRYIIGIDSSRKMVSLIANSSSAIISTGTNAIPTSTWKMITAVFDRSGNMSFYINGVSETVASNADISSFVSDNITDTSIPFRIGSYAAVNKTDPLLVWDGNIGTTMLYFRTLSSDEVLTNYNATKTRYGL